MKKFHQTFVNIIIKNTQQCWQTQQKQPGPNTKESDKHFTEHKGKSSLRLLTSLQIRIVEPKATKVISLIK